MAINCNPSKRRLSKLAAALIISLAVLTASFAGAVVVEDGAALTTENAMVVTADSIASAVGTRILLDGGNAVDAAVAVGFALAVTLPRAGNIGGGGFMLVRLHDGKEAFIDYRETAPSRAHRDMYLDENGEVVEDLSTDGHLAAGVPGTVYGLHMAHETYGNLPWKRLVEPAIRLARDGFIIGPSLAKSLAKYRDDLSVFESTKRVFITPGHETGNKLIQRDLAGTLERIANDWTDFYQGETARLIDAEMRKHGGLITLEDLDGYRPMTRDPIEFNYRGYRILAAPLPSSAGIILSQIFQMLEIHSARSMLRQSSEYVHLVSEAEKIAYRGRALYLGDNDYFPSPWQEMTLLENVSRLAGLILPDKKLKIKKLESTDLVPGWRSPAGSGKSSDAGAEKSHNKEQFEQTTHFSIVDHWGNAVANTYTLNGSYGSGVVVEGAGFLLNNEMDDFSVKPGYPNLYGLVGSEANAVAPGKRMLSSMAPTMVFEKDQLRLVLGSPGGSTIPTAVLQVILNVLDHGMTVEEAVAAGRFHEQYLPDRIYIENRALDPGVIDGLLALGHKIEIRKPIGSVQAIHVKGGELNGASDPRGSGRAVGY
jgi:gamma-glutamyltranspeptidase/glutathione hydrolase